MIAYSTTTTGGALLSALSGVATPGSFTKILGARFHLTTDANVVIRIDSSSGSVVTTLKTVDESETDETWFRNGDGSIGIACKDVYYDITTGGTAIIYIE